MTNLYKSGGLGAQPFRSYRYFTCFMTVFFYVMHVYLNHGNKLCSTYTKNCM